MIFNDAELAALYSGVQNIGAFWRLETVPVIRLWLGFGNIVAAANVLDPSGATYQGFGEIRDLPEFSVMINGAAERVEFALSGVSGQVFDLANNDDADAVKGARVSVGIGIFDAAWRLLGPPHWMANYRADFLATRQAPTGAGSDVVRVVTLSCGTLLTSRRRPGLSYFSDPDQRTRSTGDSFCDRTPRYATNFNKKWPTFPGS